VNPPPPLWGEFLFDVFPNEKPRERGILFLRALRLKKYQEDAPPGEFGLF